jgi:adenine phosphoribosyltransferase
MHDTSCVTDAWYLELIDRHTPGPRDDVSPLFANSAAFAGAVSDLAARCEPLHVDVVAAIDALGFVLGAAVAHQLRCGLILLRKADKLPVPTLRQTFTDYSGETKALEMRRYG